MKLSERIRTEISKAGVIRWNELSEEVAQMEVYTASLEKLKSNIDDRELQNNIYLSGLEQVMYMCRANSLDMETNRYILQLYNDQFKVINNG